MDGDGEVNHGGAAEDADGGVGVTVSEGRPSGVVCGFALGAAAEGDPDSGDVASSVTSDPGHHAGRDADGSAVAELEGIPEVGHELADLSGHCGLEGRG